MDSSGHSGRRTLGKRDKFTLKNDFDEVRRLGKKVAAPGVLVVITPGDRTRCGVVCGKKYSLSSVVRNRARRLLWESFRLLKPEIAPCRLILIPRRKMASYRRNQVTVELAQILAQEKLLPTSVAACPPEC